MLAEFDYIKYAQRFVDQIRANGIELKVAKIFGSFTKHTQTELSDLDVLLVSDSFVGCGFIDNKLIAEALVEFDLIQTKTYSLEDYLESDPFLDEINKNSIQLN